MTREERELSGRHALVTGGGRGIGAAIAAALVGQGASVTITGRDEAALCATAERLMGMVGLVEPIVCDVTSEDSVSEAFARARERLGSVDILVNNAGQGKAALLTETTLELWQRMLAVNLTGTFLCSREALPDMQAAGWGRIVNVSSVAGLRGHARITAYSASKFGVNGFTQALAEEVVRKGITVNAVCPSYTDTEMTDRAVAAVAGGTGRSEAEARALIEKRIPLGRLIRPEEVAAAVLWLCSRSADAVTGVMLPVAGGEA
jgi:NAD(P)-dependent dehydrogenase (short-subunit alcohol dehydrogenase family)